MATNREHEEMLNEKMVSKKKKPKKKIKSLDDLKAARKEMMDAMPPKKMSKMAY